MRYGSLNQHFPGTFNASLIIEADQPGALTDPEVVVYVGALQDHWKSVDAVGQTTSYVDVIKGTIPSGEIPGDQDEIERALKLAFGLPSGNLVGGLITDDYGKANVQFLMKDGDNQAMQEVIDRTDGFLKDNPLPPGISTAWAGETFLNLIWQDKMVSGMLKAFITTFAVVLVLVILLFRSLRWGLVAMLPMSATVLLVYGALGFAGKDYDMLLAVLSTLVLGISIDFAIHFLQRYREQMKETLMTSGRALSRVFEEPARAIARNALIRRPWVRPYVLLVSGALHSGRNADGLHYGPECFLHLYCCCPQSSRFSRGGRQRARSRRLPNRRSCGGWWIVIKLLHGYHSALRNS